jgi:Uma2 family endonuclease
VDDYLARAAAQPEASRTELINGQIVFIAPEQLQHNRLKNRILSALEREIGRTGREAEAFTSGVTIPIDAHTAYEPDASVRLGPPLSGREMKIPDPVIVFEVLSPSSRHMDTSAKLIGYFRISSMQHYLVIDPDARTVTHHWRDTDVKIASQNTYVRRAPARSAGPHRHAHGCVWLRLSGRSGLLRDRSISHWIRLVPGPWQDLSLIVELAILSQLLWKLPVWSAIPVPSGR